MTRLVVFIVFMVPGYELGSIPDGVTVPTAVWGLTWGTSNGSTAAVYDSLRGDGSNTDDQFQITGNLT